MFEWIFKEYSSSFYVQKLVTYVGFFVYLSRFFKDVLLYRNLHLASYQ